MIGGCGDVGRLILPALAERHRVRVFDLAEPTPAMAEDFCQGSVTDPDAVAAAMHGQDAVVFLAMGPKADWGTPRWAAANFDVSVTGLHLTLNAAGAAGVKRFVHTSSASVFTDYKLQDHTRDPAPDADDTYGLSKRLGEQVCAAASRQFDMSVTSLRLVGPMSDDDWQTDISEHRDVVTAGSDVARAYLAALDLHHSGFRALIISGDTDRAVIDWSGSRTALGWSPQARRDGSGTS
ncbi:NAD(P)-dependent oxidoreductase [Occultella aeris]|uniref:3 beta-hydroxysteroid dehydrogenase/Delta 5-->4-isomerase n=1 Tax=Occultella aeris TaxID=2761496 RepID=A0A7M4DFH9_9MICO|nr:3 beta-hydroxysteroid dehydrogenase/Delta 5-->4-isomerase [Occultella aeris]